MILLIFGGTRRTGPMGRAACRLFQTLSREDSPHRRHREGESTAFPLRPSPPQPSGPAALFFFQEVSYGEGGFQSQEVLRSASLLEAPLLRLDCSTLPLSLLLRLSMRQTVEQKKLLSFLEENQLLSRTLGETKRKLLVLGLGRLQASQVPSWTGR